MIFPIIACAAVLLLPVAIGLLIRSSQQPISEPNPLIIRMWDHTGWGNSIRWFIWEQGKITGHISDPYKLLGAEIQSKLQSGKIGRYRVVHVNKMFDPPDMFFATVRHIGFVEN